MMNDILKPIAPMNFQDLHYVSMPVVIIPAVRGLRVVTTWDSEENKVVFSNGEKRYDFPHISKQLYSFMYKHPRIILDGVFSYKGKTLEEVTELIKKKSILLNYYLIDALPNNFNVKAWQRADIYKRLSSSFIECKNVKLLRFKRASIDTLMRKANNEFIDEGYSGCFIRVGAQKNPFTKEGFNNYHFIKTQGKI